MGNSKILVRTLIVAAIFAVPVNGSSQTVGSYMTGEDLTKYCRDFLTFRRTGSHAGNAQQALDYGLCYGFVVGVIDQYAGLRTPSGIPGDEAEPFCTGGANANSIAETVAIYLDQHPEQRNAAAYILVRRILAEKFPC